MATGNSNKKDENIGKQCLHHETKRSALKKFILLLGIIVAYFGFMSYKYGMQDGLAVTILTWSFFVFCTPIADAGFLIDFPVRLLTRLRMIQSEMGVWITATAINIYSLSFTPSVYETNSLLKAFHYILLHPFPMWFIIILSAAGTFFSVYFGDELMDTIHHKDRVKYKQHKHKHRIIIIAFIAIGIIISYGYLIKQLGISIPA